MANSGKPALVFIVEDNDPDVFLVEEALRLEGVVARIQRCHDGEEAIHVLSQIGETQLPNIIIIDLNLPKVTGLEILKHVRSLKQMDGSSLLLNPGAIGRCPSNSARMHISVNRRRCLSFFPPSVRAFAHCWNGPIPSLARG